MSGLYADAFSQARSPAAAFHAVDLRLSLERALAVDLASLLAERAELERAYAQSLKRLQQRLRASGQKDSVYRETEALLGGLSPADLRTADQQLGQGWSGLRLSLENDLGETARVHQNWADKLTRDVGEPLRASISKGEWARWSATEAQLAAQTREYEQALDKVQKTEAKGTKGSKSSSQQQKLLQSQSSLSTVGSQLAAALPAFLDQSQQLDLAHGAFLKEALVRCGTLVADLGRERMETGERLTVQVLGVDENAEAEEWALRESIKLGGAGGAEGDGRAGSTAAPPGGAGGMPSIGEFGEGATGGGRDSNAMATRSAAEDSASTRSGATAQTHQEQRSSCAYLESFCLCSAVE